MNAIPKILLVGPAFKNGGAEKRFYNLSKNLFNRKADVCTLHESKMSDSDISDQKIISLGWKRTLDYPRVIFKLINIVRNGKYDVVMGFGLYPNLVVWLATRVFKKRPIVILSEITRPWTAYCSHKNTIRGEMIRVLRTMAYRSADLFTANSIDGIAESVAHFKIRENLARRIPNIIDKNEINEKAEQPLNLSYIRQKNKIAVVSRLINMKRIDTALEAIALLPKDTDCALIIAGEGTDLPNLKQQAKDLGIIEKVYFLGWLENPLPLVRQSSMYAICSEYEGFSNSVLEAMFLDVPVITSYCSTDAKQMCQQGAALGFEPGDAKTLSEHFLTLMTSKTRRKRLIHEAISYRSWHECSTAISFYEQIISESFEKFENRSLTC